MPRKRTRRKKTRTPDKRSCQTSHFKRRFLERYGIDPNRDMRQQILTQIQTGRSSLIHAQSLRVSIHAVWVDEQRYPIVYDRLRKSLVTVLPKECLNAEALDAHYEDDEGV